MTWQLIMTAASAVLFFVFVIFFCVRKFGLLNCYSAYAGKWVKLSPVKGFNFWSLVTIVTAAMLIPPILDSSEGSVWQFTAFFCPALIIFVGMTPGYLHEKMAQTIHVVCANAGAAFAIAFILLVVPQLWWLIAVYVALATAATLIWKNWCFWFEMAAYEVIYTAMILLNIPAVKEALLNV